MFKLTEDLKVKTIAQPCALIVPKLLMVSTIYCYKVCCIIIYKADIYHIVVMLTPICGGSKIYLTTKIPRLSYPGHIYKKKLKIEQ